MPSTSLRDISYDPSARTLDVTFVASGKRYRYFDVEPDEYAALRGAFAKGVHFNREIKPRHRFAVLAAPPPEAHFCDRCVQTHETGVLGIVRMFPVRRKIRPISGGYGRPRRA